MDKKRLLEDPGNQMLEHFICVSTNRVHMCKINVGRRVKGYQADVRRAEDGLSSPQTLAQYVSANSLTVTFEMSVRERSCLAMKCLVGVVVGLGSGLWSGAAVDHLAAVTAPPSPPPPRRTCYMDTYRCRCNAHETCTNNGKRRSLQLIGSYLLSRGFKHLCLM